MKIRFSHCEETSSIRHTRVGYHNSMTPLTTIDITRGEGNNPKSLAVSLLSFPDWKAIQSDASAKVSETE